MKLLFLYLNSHSTESCHPHEERISRTSGRYRRQSLPRVHAARSRTRIFGDRNSHLQKKSSNQFTGDCSTDASGMEFTQQIWIQSNIWVVSNGSIECQRWHTKTSRTRGRGRSACVRDRKHACSLIRIQTMRHSVMNEWKLRK